MARRRACIVLGLVTLATLAGCDGGDGTSGLVQDGAFAPDLAAETTDTASEVSPTDSSEPADTSVAPDTQGPGDTEPGDSAPVDTAPAQDTAPADTAPPDTFDTLDHGDADQDTGPLDAGPADTADTSASDGDAEVCTADCIDVAPGLPGVAITLQDLAVNAPTLRGLVGASAPLGRFELTAVDVYPRGAVPSFVALAVADGGDTNGAAEIAADAWGVYLYLDLAVSLSAFGQGFDQAARQELSGGGCYTLVGAILQSDLSRCAAGWPADVDVPDEAEFEYDDASGTLMMKLALSKDFLLSLVPPEYAGLANLVISGPLNLVLTLAAAGPL